MATGFFAGLTSGLESAERTHAVRQDQMLRRDVLNQRVTQQIQDQARARISSTFKAAGDIVQGYRDQQIADGAMGIYKDAIAAVESEGSGGYQAIGPQTRSGDRAYGKYQVMGENIPVWTKEVMGEAMSPQEFLARPDVQEAVFESKFGELVSTHGSLEDAASVWFTGRTLAEGGAEASDGFLTGQEYVDRVVSNARKMPGQNVDQIVSSIIDTVRPIAQKAGIDIAAEEQQLRAVIASMPDTIQRAVIEGRAKGAGRMAESAVLQEGGIPQGRAEETAGIAGEASTDDITEWRQAVQNGFEGSLLDWIRATRQTGRTGGTPLPNPPQGFDYRRGPGGEPIIDPTTGTGVLVPIQGGPAAIEAEEAEEKAEERRESEVREADIVLQDVNRAIQLITENPMTTTGVGGAALQSLPQTVANDVNKLLGTVRSIAGFDKLQQIRDQSPTGGALGPVSDFEVKQLQATLGSLEQSQTFKQTIRNAERVRRLYLEIVHGKEAADQMLADMLPGGLTQEDIDFNMQKYGVAREDVIAEFLDQQR